MTKVLFIALMEALENYAKSFHFFIDGCQMHMKNASDIENSSDETTIVR